MKCFQPKVSVIIPCYNRENFIHETIDSVLSQQYDNIQVIAINDGSTDSTRQILESYNKRVRVLSHAGGVNRGQAASINLGLRVSDGKYIALLDSDDLWAPHKINSQVQFLEDHTDIGVVYANGFAINEKSEKLYKLIPPGHCVDSRPERVLLQPCFNLPSNALVRRTSYDLAGEFDETLFSASDHDMTIRLAEVTKFAYIDDILWYYRKHRGGQSLTHAKRQWEEGFKVLDKAFQRRNYKFFFRRKRMAVLYFRLGECMLAERNYLKAFVRFACAGILDSFRFFRILLKFFRNIFPETCPKQVKAKSLNNDVE